MQNINYIGTRYSIFHRMILHFPLVIFLYFSWCVDCGHVAMRNTVGKRPKTSIGLKNQLNSFKKKKKKKICWIQDIRKKGGIIFRIWRNTFSLNSTLQVQSILSFTLVIYLLSVMFCQFCPVHLICRHVLFCVQSK